MKKILSLVLILTMVCTICTVFPSSGIITVFAESDTYFWGFDDDNIPSEMTLKNIDYSLDGGILTADAKRLSGYADPMITIKKSFDADDVNQLRIRMKHDLEERDNQDPIIQLFFSVDNGDGTSTSLNGSDSFSKKISLSSDGKYVTYILDLTGKANYKGTISYVRLDHTNCYGSIDIDYIMLTKSDVDVYAWEFDSQDDTKEWVSSSSAGITVSDGLLNFPEHAPVDKNGSPSPYDVTMTYTPSQSINTSKYDCVEVIMKHDISGDTITTNSDRYACKMYLTGKTSDDNGITTEVKLAEGNKKLITLSDTSGESFYRYVFPLSGTLTGGVNIDNMAISSIRLDPINAVGNFAIDSIRIIPKSVVYQPLDKSTLKLSYNFKNSYPGCAKGTVKIDFGGQNPMFATKVILKWASGNKNDGYIPLAEHKALKSTDGSVINNGYVISKDMMIPSGATALIATVYDSNGNFDLAIDIPEVKRISLDEPNYTIALTSDYHFGNVSSTAYGDRQIAAYEALTAIKPDVITVDGDITQWYGAYSKAALDCLNDDDTTNDNPTAGVSQWDKAFDYFTQFNTDDLKIPVYLVEGNHDTPEGSYSMDKKKGVTPQHMKDLLERWINYSVSEGLYPDAIERQDVLYEGKTEKATWYDDYVYDDEGNAYHFVFIRIPHLGNYTMPQQELDWLDEKLSESEEKGIVTFLFTHVPYINTIGDHDFKYAMSFKDANFKTIIDKHPKTVVVSAHTHYTIDCDYASTVNGMMKSPSFVHQGSVDTVYISDNEQIKSQSHISIAQMYDDMIVIKGYDTISKLWVPQSFAMITYDEIEDSDGVDSEGTVTTPDAEQPDVRTLIANVTDENGINPLTTTAGAVGTWVENKDIKDGYIGRLTSNEATHRVTWQLKNTWQKQNSDSKYIDISYNVYPLNENSTNFYLGTNQSKQISAYVGDAVVPYKWNNVRVIIDLSTLKTDTYVNGKYIDSYTTTFGNVDNTAANKNYFRFCLASINAKDVVALDAYIDDILIYETVKKPVVPPVHYMFIKGVSDGIITSDAVTMVINNTKVGEFVAAAQFDNKDGLLGVKYILSETVGLNELSLDIEDDTEYVIVFVWDNLSTLKPLINEYTLSVE